MTCKKLPNVYKVAQNWLQKKNERFWHLYKNCLKCGRFGQNNCCHWLWKVAQSGINRPFLSHCCSPYLLTKARHLIVDQQLNLVWSLLESWSIYDYFYRWELECDLRGDAVSHNARGLKNKFSLWLTLHNLPLWAHPLFTKCSKKSFLQLFKYFFHSSSAAAICRFLASVPLKRRSYNVTLTTSCQTTLYILKTSCLWCYSLKKLGQQWLLSFFSISLFLTIQWQRVVSINDRKKNRWCAWDSNPRPQNGRPRQNHRAFGCCTYLEAYACPCTYLTSYPRCLNYYIIGISTYVILQMSNSWHTYNIKLYTTML